MLWFAFIKGRLSNIHIKGSKPDIFIISTPRSGSTFLMETLYAQPGVKIFDEPLNINYPVVRRELNCKTWEEATTLTDREVVYKRYFDRLRRNKIPELNRPIYRSFSRFLTNRNVFKVIHGAEDMVGWLKAEFDADIIVLVRHPIPTTLSHRQYPRLPYFLKQPNFRSLFTREQIDYAEKIISTGDNFEKGIVNWCLQNRPPLINHFDPSWAIVSYEDLTIFPDRAIAYLKEKLQLDKIKNLNQIVIRPSGSTDQSDFDTKVFFSGLEERTPRNFLINKWRSRITKEQEKKAFDILHLFDIDFYEIDNDFPADKYRIPPLT